MDAPLLRVENLVARYGKALAIDGISIEVRAGEVVGVLGPNGAGKSTLLKAISRMLPTSGGIWLRGRDLSAEAPHAVVAAGICHCPEGRRLFPDLTVQKNLMLGAYLRRDRPGIEDDLARVCRLFPILAERRGQVAGTLSGGEQQMVAIGRALMGRPAILLLDEPSVGIAHRLKAMIFQAIKDIRASGTAVLLVEQDARSTLSVADRLYLLEHGRVSLEGSSSRFADDDHIRRSYLGV